jgi:signal recognition particle subunit SRP54
MLEADVALPVVKHFIDAVRAGALGEEVVGSLTPGQALVGVVHRELTKLMGEASVGLDLAMQPPAVILMAGLQGSGKTTTTGKLARFLVKDKKKVAVVSADVYRPAAIEQLKTVAGQAGAAFIESRKEERPVDIARRAVDYARTHYMDVLIVDTAGRLAIDEDMMREIAELHAQLKPVETLFIVDAMQGQDAVNVARAFNERLPLTGVILTKLDGDARGGAALSVRHVTGKPIKFAGVAEKLDGLEPFHPERMAARILGMGDILSLVEEAHAKIDLEEAQRVADKVKKGKGFDLEDFKQQIVQMKKMGGVASLMDKLPAQLVGQIDPAKLQDETQFRRIEGIINAMTPQERRKPELIKASRKRRIATGAGVPVQAVNQLLNQFEQMQKMMKMMKGGNFARMMRGMKGMLPGIR